MPVFISFNLQQKKMKKIEANLVKSFNIVKRDLSEIRRIMIELESKHDEIKRMIRNLESRK